MYINTNYCRSAITACGTIATHCGSPEEVLIKPYPIPASTSKAEDAIKKSRFITCIGHTPGLEAAKAFVAQLKEQYPDARHHCWACVAGAPSDGQQFGFSDDGEPSGTAGKPMLAVLQGSGLGEITAVSVRYFGGVKLGTGGLVKAYASGVKLALATLPTRKIIPQAIVALTYNYSRQSTVERILSEFEATTQDAVYADKIQLSVSVDARQREALRAQLIERTQGDIEMALPESLPVQSAHKKTGN